MYKIEEIEEIIEQDGFIGLIAVIERLQSENLELMETIQGLVDCGRCCNDHWCENYNLSLATEKALFLISKLSRTNKQ